jgi:hypothetical protein
MWPLLIPLIGAALGFISSGGISDVVAQLDPNAVKPAPSDWAGDAAGTAIGGVGGAMAGPWVGAAAGQIGGTAANITKSAVKPPVNAGAIKAVEAEQPLKQVTQGGVPVTAPTSLQPIPQAPSTQFGAALGPVPSVKPRIQLRRVQSTPSTPAQNVVGPDMVAIDESGLGNQTPGRTVMVPNIDASKYPNFETPEQQARLASANPTESRVNGVPIEKTLPLNGYDMFSSDQTPITLAPGKTVNTYLPMPQDTAVANPQGQQLLVEWAKQMQTLNSPDPNLNKVINDILTNFGG